MAVTIDDVRKQLNNLSTDLVPDSTVDQQIKLATERVNKAKSADANTTLVDYATLVYAAYLTYVAYTTEVERSTGFLPASFAVHLAELKEIAETFLRIVGEVKVGINKVTPVLKYISSPVREKYGW